MQNPFSSSPFSTEPQFSDEPAKTSSSTVSRGLAPTRQDLMKRATELGVDPNLAISFFSQESSGNWNSNDSPRGARGGMQVMPGTYRSMMGTSAGQDDPWNNMEAGLRYIAYGQRRLGTKDPELLAAGYHAGYDHPSLRRGEIPNTNDGMISTRDYARSVAGRVHPKLFPDSVQKDRRETAPSFSDAPVVESSDFSSAPVTDEKAESSSGNIFTDIGKNLKIGMNTAAEDVMELIGKIPVVGEPIVQGASAVDEYFTGKPTKQLLKDDTQEMISGMTPEMKEAISKNWWDSGKGTFGSAWADPRSYISGVVQSLPEQALTMVPAMRLAKAAYASKIAAGATAEVASAAAAKSAQIAGSVGEGLLGGAQSSREVRDTIMQMNPEVLAQSEAYQDLIRSGMTAQMAQKTLAEDAASQAFLMSGVTTGLFGGMGDRALAKIFTEKAGKLTAGRVVGNAVKGAIAEGVLEEAPQSATQAMSQNLAIQKADPNRSITEDVANQTLGGLAIGAAQGGGMAAMASRGMNLPEDNSPGAVFGRELEQAVADTDLSQPQKPQGPLSGAMEKAAQGGERVTATDQAGNKVSGTIAETDGKRVTLVDDEGNAVAINLDSMKVEREQGPLTSAVEAAADAHAEAPITATDSAVPDQQIPNGDGITQEPRQAPKADYNSMTEDELRDRLRYIADQAKNNGGWNTMLTKERATVEKAINAKVKSETPKVEQPSLDFSSTKPEEAATASIQPSIQEKAEPAQVKASEPTAAIQDPIQKEYEAAKAAWQKDHSEPALQRLQAAKKALAQVTQPAQSGTTGEVAGAYQPTQVAPKTKTASKEDLDHLFGIDKKREKALERIAKGTAYFHDGVKAKDFIKKNGLGDTHEVKQGKGGRWDIVAKVAPHMVPNSPERDAAIADAMKGIAEHDKAEKAKQEATNGNDERTSGKPAGAEEVGEKADAGQGKAAAVQPAAKEKVTPSSRVVRTYTTRGGAVGAEIKENTGPDGKVSYSYNGKWGAGSGIDAESMRQTEAQWHKSKSGYTLKESGNADELENANNRGGEREQPAAEQAADVTAGREVREEGRGQEEVANVDALTRAESGSIAEPAEQKPSTLMDRVKAARDERLAETAPSPTIQAKENDNGNQTEAAGGSGNRALEGVPAEEVTETEAQDEAKSAHAAEQKEAKKHGKSSNSTAKNRGDWANGSKSKIEDFGEKIGGARKDTWSGFKDDLNAISDDDIAGQPLSKIWPAPDYAKMVEDGTSSEVVATIRSMRDEIPAKPRQSYKVKRWAEQVKTLREFANSIIDGKTTLAEMKEMAGANRALEQVFGRIELYMAAGHEKSLQGVRLSFHHYTIYKGDENVSMWSVEQDAKATAWSNWPREIATGKTKEDAIAAFKSKYATLDINTPASKQATFEIYSKSGENGYWIGKKVGRNPILLEGPFDNIKEARAYKDANNDKLVTKLEKAKEVPNERRETNEPRVGVDMRNGQDVTPHLFAETFGFKGVEFGNWVEGKKRQQDLNEAFDALMDMAAILNLPPNALSLNGELGLAFGARGKGGINPAKAHYEPDYVAINMTKKDGAGSLGHEWWHALDNYFSRMRGKSGDMMTEALDVSLSSRGSEFVENTKVRKQMIVAFGNVVRAIKQTALKERSAKLDTKRSKAYWTTQPEMSARAFESFLISKLQDQNAANDYLANIVDEKTWKAAESLGFDLDESYPYPTAGEVPAIRAAFEKFFETIETREEGGNIAIRQNKGDVENGEATGGNDERGSVFGTNTEIGNVADLRRDAIGGITWRAKGITDDLVQDGVGQLVGQSAATPREVAAIAQIYRNPRFETARFVLTRGGKVVFETGATARLPGATNFFPGGIADAAAYLRGAMKRANADGYYMLHNHPSGDPTPSKSDIDYTRKLANSVKGFSGHVIINSNKYAVIDASGNGNVEHENFGEDMLLKASKPHKVIGYQIKTFGDVAEVGKSFQFSGYVTAIGVSGNPAKVRAVGSIDADSIGKDSVREFAQQSGSDGIYLFAARDDLALNDARKLMREGFINNAMFEDGSMVSSLTGDTGLAVLQFGSELKGPVEAGEGAEQKEGEQPAASRRDVTATEEFKKWFGDSKVVDAKGSPLVVYHGTNARFDTFDPDTSVEGGFFFTADKSHASGFGGNTVEAYLSLKNPLVVDVKDIPIEHELGDIERIIQRAKEEKHDGVFIRGFRDMTDTPADTYIVFEPTQIKSATGNNGDFDASNPDILASREGSIDPAAAMAYVEDNFWSILEELNDAKLVEIVC